MTRPDITCTVSNVAKYSSKPTKENCAAVKKMRYLKGTQSRSHLQSDSSGCIGFSDSEWAGDLDDLKLTSGYLFQAGGTAVSWRSRK
uniref:Reverse transcriptase Ty1/copia-type domain-containing protein n=1 Tax=Amphimedon queenslandica TaxID=400682 RepID=A0A1X7SWS6_AMPQE